MVAEYKWYEVPVSDVIPETELLFKLQNFSHEHQNSPMINELIPESFSIYEGFVLPLPEHIEDPTLNHAYGAHGKLTKAKELTLLSETGIPLWSMEWPLAKFQESFYNELNLLSGLSGEEFLYLCKQKPERAVLLSFKVIWNSYFILDLYE